MFLYGSVNIGSDEMYLCLHDTKPTETYLLISKHHVSDMPRVLKKEKLEHAVLGSPNVIPTYFDLGYVLEGVKRTKVSGKVYEYRTVRVLETILQTISYCKTYHFLKDCITEDTEYQSLSDLVSEFAASDNDVSFVFKKVNGFYEYLCARKGNIKIELHSSKKTIPVKTIPFKESTSAVKKKVLKASLVAITYEQLQQAIDLSWYEQGGKVLKNYRSIKTKEEFEEFVMKPLAQAIKKNQQSGKKSEVIIGLDTETTGTMICNLSWDNPVKDHCVAIPLSWEDNQAVTIFTDMEYFDSIPNEYVWKRLSTIIERDQLVPVKTISPDLSLYKQKALGVSKLTAFDDTHDDASSYDNITDHPIPDVPFEPIQFNRDELNIVGHNVMFDGKVAMDFGVLPYFDNDTLQMAFDLNPKVVRGNNKLKALTHRLFGHETPELEDILGKGNEDKYKYLTDERVAIIYGCADADYTRLLYKKLRSIMTDHMYNCYKHQDPPMLNILYQSEYYGLPMNDTMLKNLAETSKSNLEILKNFMYHYVGGKVYYDTKRRYVEAQYNSGSISEKEYNDLLNNISVPSDAVYEFEVKASEIRKVMYDILKYPIISYTDSKNPLPKTDKYVMEKLKKVKSDVPGTYMKKDILITGASYDEYEKLLAANKAKKAKELVLISAEEFNKCKYPLTIVLAKYAELNKEYTSYFKPSLENNLEGKMFKSYSLARIETRRIMNPGQTMKGSLKALEEPYGDDYYTCDFDMSQVELRIMFSEAGDTRMIEKMKFPESDVHQETGAIVNHKEAYLVTKKERKNAKKVSFGKPYGLGETKMREDLGYPDTPEGRLLTRKVISEWEENNSLVVDFLERSRDEALTEQEISDDLRDFIDAYQRNPETQEYLRDTDGNRIKKPVSMVKNKLGFYRMFDLSGMDPNHLKSAIGKRGNFRGLDLTDYERKKIGSIRRAAGNYPIQAFASELFRMILIRFYNRCVKEGIADKIIWHMLIHDELLCSVHKSINPFYLYKIIYEECMVTIKDHTKYFVGINMGHTWADCKSDSREAPVFFVQRMIKRWDAGEFANDTWIDDAWEYIKPYRQQYIVDRIGEVIREIQPGIDDQPINMPLILDKFTNYTVRSYLNDYFSTNGNLKQPDSNASDSQKDLFEKAEWQSKFDTWAIQYFGEGKEIIRSNGKLEKLETIRSNEIIPIDFNDDTSYSDLFDDDIHADKGYWSFDSEDLRRSWTQYRNDYEEFNENDDDIFDFSVKGATNVADLIVKKKDYKNLLLVNKRLFITVGNRADIKKCKNFLVNSEMPTGYKVVFKTPLGTENWITVDDGINLEKLDQLIN